ncbi:hypothetical protein KIN20_028347 [Parelaphostrongylus tenuis]|uniref:Uncharacterized protein n=1 Tax=Parelaphostrongylus tenuis TaxID=148309 RepID=A0AAD5R113_PARTN|nr:hypothetical protein KIN20_028347 [Parelaphostrongylus tenuis]
MNVRKKNGWELKHMVTCGHSENIIWTQSLTFLSKNRICMRSDISILISRNDASRRFASAIA